MVRCHKLFGSGKVRKGALYSPWLSPRWGGLRKATKEKCHFELSLEIQVWRVAGRRGWAGPSAEETAGAKEQREGSA